MPRKHLYVRAEDWAVVVEAETRGVCLSAYLAEKLRKDFAEPVLDATENILKQIRSFRSTDFDFRNQFELGLIWDILENFKGKEVLAEQVLKKIHLMQRVSRVPITVTALELLQFYQQVAREVSANLPALPEWNSEHEFEHYKKCFREQVLAVLDRIDALVQTEHSHE